MGNNTSSEQEIEKLATLTPFTAEELTRLHKRFSKLDRNNNGRLDKDEFMTIEGVSGNPLLGRVLEIFDSDGGGDVDFKEFLLGVAAFTASSSSNKKDSMNDGPEKDMKLKFMFKVYDMDRDGFISNGELYLVLKMMVGSNLKEHQLQQVVDKTIRDADLDGDGKISFEEFCTAVKVTDFYKEMNSCTFEI